MKTPINENSLSLKSILITIDEPTNWRLAHSEDPVQIHILQHLIWVYTVCSGLYVPIHRLNTVLMNTVQQSHMTTFQIFEENWFMCFLSMPTKSKQFGLLLCKLWPEIHLYYQLNFTLVLLIPDMPCLCKQCRSRSVGFFRSQLIWIFTVCH